MKSSLFLGMLLLLLFTSFRAVHATSAPALTEQGITGVVMLGDSADKVIAALGKEDASEEGMAGDALAASINAPDLVTRALLFRSKGLVVHVQKGKVIQITITSAAYKTKDGLGVGSTFEAFEKVYGDRDFGGAVAPLTPWAREGFQTGHDYPKRHISIKTADFDPHALPSKLRKLPVGAVFIYRKYMISFMMPLETH